MQSEFEAQSLVNAFRSVREALRKAAARVAARRELPLSRWDRR